MSTVSCRHAKAAREGLAIALRSRAAVWNYRLQCRFARGRDAMPRAIGIHMLLDPAPRHHSVESHLAGWIQLSRQQPGPRIHFLQGGALKVVRNATGSLRHYLALAFVSAEKVVDGSLIVRPLTLSHIPTTTTREIFPHFGQVLFIQPALLPFFIKRIEDECQRNADEKTPHSDTGLFPHRLTS
jgi:hypothetical protein